MLEEQRLLSDVLFLLLQTPTIPAAALQKDAFDHADRPLPDDYRVAKRDKELSPEFWTALDQKLKLSLNYVITLAMLVESIPGDAQLPPAVQQTSIVTDILVD